MRKVLLTLTLASNEKINKKLRDMKRRCGFALTTIVIFICLFSLSAPGTERSGPFGHLVRIPELETSGELNTDLTKAPWTKASKIIGTFDFRRNETASFPFWAYLFYDSEALWVAYRCEAISGDNLRAKTFERDGPVMKEEDFELYLSGGFLFATNVAGTIYDSHKGADWDSNVSVRATTDKKGWTAVMRVPFADLDREEPKVGEVLGFNIKTQTGTTNSWAPQMAKMVFGGKRCKPVRLHDIQPPLAMGQNSIALEVPDDTRYILSIQCADTQAILPEVRLGDTYKEFLTGNLSGKQSISFFLRDSIRRVYFAFSDRKGNLLTSFWMPVESEMVTRRFSRMRERTAFLKHSLERFPENFREDVKSLVSEAEAFLSEPLDYLFEGWKRLSKTFRSLERRVNDAWLYAETLGKLSEEADFAVGLQSPMQKEFILDFPFGGWCEDHYDLSLARNEHEGMQVIVVPVDKALKNLHVSISKLKDRTGNALLGGQQVSLVGHVMTETPGLYSPEYEGWYPDPLLDFQQSCDATTGEHIAFWIDVRTEKQTVPGDYSGSITISADGCQPLSVRLNVHVWDFELTDGTHLRNAFTYAPFAASRFYGEKWSKKLAYKYYDFILNHRLNIDALYGRREKEVEVLKYGISRGMNAFNIFYVSPGAAKDKIVELLKERVPPLKEAGIYEQAYIFGFDEKTREDFPKMKQLFGAIHDTYPDLETMTTSYDTSFGKETGLRDVVDIWVPLTPRYDLEKARKLRAEGKDMWWYICCGPRHPYANWFVEYPAIEARLLMGAMSFKYRVGGVLYYLINHWNLNDHPITSGPYTDWNPGSGHSKEKIFANGDGSIFCPGPEGPLSTIRMENIRDGLEDYEYFYLLRHLIEELQQYTDNEDISGFVEVNTPIVSDLVVRNMKNFTYDCSDIAALRKRVASAIIRGKELLDQLAASE